MSMQEHQEEDRRDVHPESRRDGREGDSVEAGSSRAWIVAVVLGVLVVGGLAAWYVSSRRAAAAGGFAKF